LYSSTTRTNDFHATPYGSANPTGQHSYQIKLTDSSTAQWRVYVDGVQALTLANSSCRRPDNGQVYNTVKAVEIYAGLENKDSLNSFTQNTRIDNWQYLRATDGRWQMIDGTAVRSGNANNLGWVSSFSTSSTTPLTNKITFTRP
jgi:hypothetical protein